MRNSAKFAFLICLKSILLSFNALLSITPELIQEANESYIAGERAETVSKRKEAFNHALSLYKQAEAESYPEFSNGKLYYNIANTYFQLEEYPWAILYDYKALQLRPDDERIQRNLDIALDKAGVFKQNEESVFQRIFFWHNSIPLPKRLQIIFILSTLLLVVISIYIWNRNTNWKKVIYFVGFVWVLFFGSVLYSRYFSSIDGVIVNPTLLFLGAGSEYAAVTDQPVISGSKVQVLEILQDGKWVKVMTTSGKIGYIPNTSLQVI